VHLQSDVAFYLEIPEHRVKTVDFDVSKKVPKLFGYHRTSLQILQKLFQFYNLHTRAYQSWKVAEVWSSTCWDIWYDMSIFAVSSQKLQKLSARSLRLVDWSSPKLHRSSKNCALYYLKGEIAIFESLQNASMLKKGHFENFKGIKKRSGSRKFTQIPFIWWKDRKNRSSRSWDNLSQVKKEETRKMHGKA